MFMKRFLNITAANVQFEVTLTSLLSLGSGELKLHIN